MYDLNSKFDIEQHKKTFVNYLEVVIYPDGLIEYATPSHQEKLINICCKQLNVTRDKLNKMCPQSYYADFMVWLCNLSGCISVWDRYIVKPQYEITTYQYESLVKLIDAKLLNYVL